MAGHRFNPDKAEKLLDPRRKEIINPENILTLLDVTANDTVADLGSGNGLFTLPFAQKTKETVYAVDIEPKMLDFLRDRASEHHLTNIQYVESDLEKINLPDNCVHKALVAFVMHEIPNMDHALAEFKRILKQGGKLMILDWEAVESEMGPPLHERISSDKMKAYLQEKGFHSTVHPIHESIYGILIQMK